MADSAISTTRRSFLSAGVITAVVAGSASTASLAASPRSSWEAVRAAYLKAEKAVNDYDRDHLTPAFDRYDTWRSQFPLHIVAPDNPALDAAYDTAQSRFDELVERRLDAMKAMLAHPAPDNAAIAFKIEVMIDDSMWECENFEDAMHALAADNRKLARGLTA